MNILACEGNSEVELMVSLIERDALIFDKKEILDKRPIRFRQPKSVLFLINALPVDTDLIFYRIGDTQKEEFDTRCLEYREKHIKVVKICTTPEIEILIIINEGLYKEYLKHKSTIRPKQFLKQFYPSIQPFSEYVNSHDMTGAIREYKRLKGKTQNELTLADLLK